MRHGMAILAVILLAYGPMVATAACYGTNSKTKQRQAVQEIYRSTSHPKRYFAASTHDPRTGRPQMIYYARYRAAPAYSKSFIRAHECCHQAANRNEIAANCCALRRLQPSSSSLAAIRDYIISRNVNSQTARRRLTTKARAAFRSKTASQCLGSAGL